MKTSTTMDDTDKRKLLRYCIAGSIWGCFRIFVIWRSRAKEIQTTTISMHLADHSTTCHSMYEP